MVRERVPSSEGDACFKGLDQDLKIIGEFATQRDVKFNQCAIGKGINTFR